MHLGRGPWFHRWRIFRHRGLPGRRRGAPGVHSSNTPPSTSKKIEIEKWTGAEDWLEWVLYIEWNKWDRLNKQLKDAKETAAMENCPPELREIWYWGGRCTVDPGGARLGKKKGPYFAYKLSNDELTVLIAERPTPHKSFPSAVVRANGESCLYPGAEECYEYTKRMIKSLGGRIIKNRLSRVDICLDMPGQAIEPFDRAFLEDRIICRAVARKRYTGTGVTVEVGQAPLKCRIYDKKAEVELKANPIKKLCMLYYRWNKVLPEAATRIEFELRRDALKDRGIDAVEDYYTKRADLVSYLTHEWIRFTTYQVDRENNNQSKAETLPIWLKAREAFLNWTGKPPGRSLAPVPKEEADVRNLIKQAMGVGKTAAEYQGKELNTTEELIAYLQETIMEYGLRLKTERKPA